jgi:ABC-type uncharacterized transport system involved in gliding motility auxiliary subunit
MPPSGDILNLLKAWGVSIDTNKLAGDPSMARRVQFGGGPGGRPVVTDYLAWLEVGTAHINQADPLAAGIERLNLASAGFFTKVEGAKTNVQPLIQTSAAAGAMDATSMRVMPDPLALAREFKSGGKPLMLAARITGEAKSAFPDGRPKPSEPAKGEKSAGSKPSDKPAAEAKKGEPASATKSETVIPHFASGPVNVIVIAESDLLADLFWVTIQELMGQRLAVPQAHNAALVINALENLSGGEALATLRGRGVNDRPFERVADIRREAERRYREKEQALNAKLKDLQGKLQKMETKSGEGGQILLSDKDRQTIEGFRNEMLEVRRQLRTVQADLRRDIDNLDGWLKFLNIAAVPLLIGIGGIAVGLSRRRRQAPGGERRG